MKGSSSSSIKQVVKIESNNSLNFVLDKTSHGSNDDSSELSVDDSNSTSIVKKCDPPVCYIPAELASTDGDENDDTSATATTTCSSSSHFAESNSSRMDLPTSLDKMNFKVDVATLYSEDTCFEVETVAVTSIEEALAASEIFPHKNINFFILGRARRRLKEKK
jgi:hypothetical protein